MRFKQDWEGELKSILFSGAVAAFICVDEIQRFTETVCILKNIHLFRAVPGNKASLWWMQKDRFRPTENSRAKIRNTRAYSRYIQSERHRSVDCSHPWPPKFPSAHVESLVSPHLIVFGIRPLSSSTVRFSGKEQASFCSITAFQRRTKSKIKTESSYVAVVIFNINESNYLHFLAVNVQRDVNKAQEWKYKVNSSLRPLSLIVLVPVAPLLFLGGGGSRRRTGFGSLCLSLFFENCLSVTNRKL